MDLSEIIIKLLRAILDKSGTIYFVLITFIACWQLFKIKKLLIIVHNDNAKLHEFMIASHQQQQQSDENLLMSRMNELQKLKFGRRG